MKVTRRQIRKIIKEAMVQSYDLGREDSLAGIRPQLPDEDYMRGYNDAQMDAGLPTMQAPSDSGRGKKLDPNLLKGALPGKFRGMNEARNVSFPFTEIAEDFQDRGYKVKKARAGDERGSALFQMPISIPGGTKDFGYYVDVKYEYGTFYFYWYLRTKASPGSQQRIKILKPGGGKPRWQAEYKESDLGVVVDEIDYEISVHAEEGTHPFDLGLPPSKFAYKG